MKIKGYIKRTVAPFVLALAVIMLPLLGGCTPSEDDESGEHSLLVTTTIFPVYDWTRTLLEGTDVRVELLLSDGGDMHGYDPSYSDIIKMKSSFLFICIGGESESWTEDVFEGEEEKMLRLIETEGITLLEANANHEHDHEHEHGESCTHNYDEHIWLSPRSAMLCVGRIKDALIELVPNERGKIEESFERYTNELVELDRGFTAFGETYGECGIIFADRYPFIYLSEDYGIECVSAFGGCSTDTNASFDVIVTLAKALNANSQAVLFTTESSDGSIASSVINASERKDARVLALDSMQSIKRADIDRGEDYISIMKSNLAVLLSAFGS